MVQGANWSHGHFQTEDQQKAMDFFKRAMSVDNTEDHQTINRKLYIVGEPGAGKTEVFIQFCSYAIANNLRVLILCPTGQLVHSYRQRLPETERIKVDTIHAGLRIRRGEEKLVQHAPPMQLRYFDAIFIDEASQIDDHTCDLLDYAVHELPHNPFIAVSADYKQLQPVGDSGKLCKMERWCRKLTAIVLRTIHRTSDNELLNFLSLVRTQRPDRADLFNFFEGRRFAKREARKAITTRPRAGEGDRGAVHVAMCDERRSYAGVQEGS